MLNRNSVVIDIMLFCVPGLCLIFGGLLEAWLGCESFNFYPSKYQPRAQAAIYEALSVMMFIMLLLIMILVSLNGHGHGH
jgi:hypothetical protein